MNRPPESVKADPQCPLQTLSVPSSDNPTSWYMETYAREQHLWMRDFAEVLDKMMTNGYPDGASWPAVDQWTDVSCSPRGAGALPTRSAGTTATPSQSRRC